MTSLEISLAQFGHQPAPAAPDASMAKPNLEPEESRAGYDPMDVDLGVIPEEEPKEKYEEAPKDEPAAEPEENRENADVREQIEELRGFAAVGDEK